MQLVVAVSDMPKAKAFYADKLGLKVTKDYRQDDDHWWVNLRAREGGITITLSTFHAHMKPGTLQLYFATSDVAAAHRELSAAGANVSEMQDNLFGPGTGVKWFELQDPDGNRVLLVQA
jgi:catechol 2,3-dioxygenase-like lactoylglutathione lyase family enzyme